MAHVAKGWLTNEPITPEWLNNADLAMEQAAAALPRTGGTVTGRTSFSQNGKEVSIGVWNDISGNSTGYFLLANNAYTTDPNGYKFSQTHASMGARGIRMTNNGIQFFDTGPMSTTADADITGIIWNDMIHAGNMAPNVERLDYRTYKTNKDANGIFTTIEQRRNDNTLAIRSVLSGGTSPLYTTRTITYYDTNGTTLLKTTTRTLTYDSDGALTSEV